MSATDAPSMYSAWNTYAPEWPVDVLGERQAASEFGANERQTSEVERTLTAHEYHDARTTCVEVCAPRHVEPEPEPGDSSTEERRAATLFALIGNTEWQRDAVCADRTDLMFPERGGSIAAARALCAKCPVRAECLQASASSEPTWDIGMWAGLSGNERRRLNRLDALAGAYGDVAVIRPPALDRRKARPVGEFTHGTRSGYQNHQYRDEPACEPCMVAKREYSRLRRVARIAAGKAA